MRIRTPLTTVFTLLLAMTPASPALAVPGDLVWSTTVSGPVNDLDVGNDAVLDPTGERLYVAGQTSRRRSNIDYTTSGFDAATGAHLWSTTTVTGGWDQAFAIASSPDGSRAYATGTTKQLNRRGGDFLTVAYDGASGSVLWSRRYDSHAGGETAHAIVALTNAVVITGLDARGMIVTIAYHPLTGRILWTSRLSGPAGGVAGIAADENGIYVAGSVFNGPTSDYFAVAYELTGEERWRFQYDGPSSFSDNATSMTLSTGGGHLYVTGKSAFFGSGDVTTIALDTTTGDVVWNARIDEPAGSDDLSPILAAGSSGDPVVVAFNRFDNVGNQSLVVAAIDDAGAVVWTTQRPGAIRALDGTFSADRSRLYFTGDVETEGEFDPNTFEMDATTGSVSWERSLSGTGGSEYGAAVVADPTGAAIYIAGILNDDIMAAAYSAT